jgi:hypothetical protein
VETPVPLEVLESARAVVLVDYSRMVILGGPLVYLQKEMVIRMQTVTS